MKKVSLTVLDGPDRGATFSFTEGACHVGRGRGELVLSDKKISGKHFRVYLSAEKVMVEDLGSTNGTFLAGRKLEKPEVLKNMDTLFAGLSKISVAIVDDLSSFKERNSEPGDFSTDSNFISQSSEIINVDDLDSSKDDEVLDGLFEDSVVGALSAKTAHVSQSEIADMIEDEDTIRAKSLGAVKKTTAEASDHEDSKPELLKEDVDLPSEEAVYRETGIQRISNLIKDELDTFSQWDNPKVSTESPASIVPRVKVKLKLRRGPEGVSSVDCSQPVTTFGRKDVDVRLNDLDVSRKHTAVEIVGGDKVFVRDLGSTNGTFVNGKKISHQEVKAGDLIQLGQTVFEVAIEGAKKSRV
jgi:pSer/pThr/pTyr-binding forkhead associated (FHA) protein